ncbi:transmembrane protein 65 [Nephila pilipes]|uniref:Transmembrane protein 65 n=1 Tax=Nephila pilipes TaxID=299642 RepID=A0A8X6TXH6_NEPPI|nr:transmembrane protein 65 [Nephila pilipes]
MAGTTRACLFSVSKCSSHLFNRVHFRTSTASLGFPGFKIADKLHSRQLAQDFIFKLNHKERAILLDELQRFQAQAAAIKEDVKPEPPSKAQLQTLLAHSAVPFIGFGFLDNLIMIIAGDYIDATIGITLGISTMAAAGLGNTLSDVAGIGSAWYVERIASKIGVKSPTLTPAQTALSRSRWCINLGRALGVTIGCLLGMFPLLFRKKDAETVVESQ